MANPIWPGVDSNGDFVSPKVVQAVQKIAKASGLPSGGTTGQVVTKQSDGSPAWATLPSGLPSGGTAGQVVTKQADGTAAWAAGTPGPKGRDVSSIVPVSGDPTKATVTYSDGQTSQLALPTGAAGKSIKTIGTPDATTGVATVTFTDGTTTTVTFPRGPKGDPGANWSKDQQAKAQGYWIVVSPEAPASATYTTADEVTVPVIWQQPITKVVPVLPQTPAFSRASSTLTVPDLVGVQYRLTGWSKDLGATWTTVSKDLAGGAVTDVKVATGQTLPVTVRVEALAKPGYALPNTYKWTFDYPDPNATVMVTSDTFTAADATLMHTRMTDAALGGTAKQWNDTGGALQVMGNKLTGTGKGGGASLAVGAFNMEAEFDLVRLDGGTAGGVPLDRLQVMVGSTGGWNSGFGFNGPRLYENSNNLSDGNASWYVGPTSGLGDLGHYKLSVVGQTGRVTVPNGSIYTANLSITRTSSQVNFLVQVWTVTPTHAIDNLVIRQVGY